MHRFLPLIGLTVAAFYMFNAANQMSVVANSQGPDVPAVGVADRPADPPPQVEKPKPKVPPDNRQFESGHKLMIRFLGDLDDILDSITGPPSFAAAKPRILARVKAHIARVSAEFPNQGLTPMSRAVAKEFQKAVNRHTESLIRADSKAPGVVKFFEKEVAPLLDRE